MARELQWTIEEANDWYKRQPWLVGCSNFIPSSAINQLEMWQADTFDPETISRELNWAAAIGFNVVRVYLHNLVWQVNGKGFVERINHYLEIADRYRIRTIFVLFDDCWNKDPKIGKQPDPMPGIHNSKWVQSPGEKLVTVPSRWSKLQDYIHGVISNFASNDLVLMWDLYNEPGNMGLNEKSLPLLQATFGWAREAHPVQPLTAGIWSENRVLNDFQLSASDIITFHNYNEAKDLVNQIKLLKNLGRPLICTEYMARTRGSLFETCLPIFKAERVGCLSLGLVSGKTQTIYQWGVPGGSSEPEIWFHDIFRKNGTPYRQEEVNLIKALIEEG